MCISQARIHRLGSDAQQYRPLFDCGEAAMAARKYARFDETGGVIGQYVRARLILQPAPRGPRDSRHVGNRSVEREDVDLDERRKRRMPPCWMRLAERIAAGDWWKVFSRSLQQQCGGFAWNPGVAWAVLLPRVREAYCGNIFQDDRRHTW